LIESFETVNLEKGVAREKATLVSLQGPDLQFLKIFEEDPKIEDWPFF
jgi:hypothetical protein